MKLGFYYHIPVRKDGNKLYTAGYLGCFLDSIAHEVNELVLFMHAATPNDSDMDYELCAGNVRLVSLGRKPRAEVRTFFGRRIIQSVAGELQQCDMLLVRAPTHLFGAWGRICDQTDVRLVPLLVGDYAAGNAGIPFSFPKKQVVQVLNGWVDRKERRYLRGKTVLVNSSVLAEKYKSIAQEVHQVRTTTLSENSFFLREDTCTGETINLLYTGRFDWQKGLQELFDAFVALVTKKGINAKLHFVGWQDGKGPSIENKIKDQASRCELIDRIIFHGKKKVGPELDALYRMADIYVLPSYAEGFPRTIWEAMANSCPVIATRVGAIPNFLTADQHACLIPPKDSDVIVAAMKRVVTDASYRRNLIIEARKLAKMNTLEVQAVKMISILKEV